MTETKILALPKTTKMPIYTFQQIWNWFETEKYLYLKKSFFLASFYFMSYEKSWSGQKKHVLEF
jgi:hypothetical protein